MRDKDASSYPFFIGKERGIHMNDFKIFTDLLGSLIAKYAEKIDLDSLPDIPKEKEKPECEENYASLTPSLAF